MATAGLSTLEAVNAMLRCVNEGALSALASSGSFPTKTFQSNVGGNAEDVLTEVSRRVQMMGWPENSDLFTTVTPVLNTATYEVVLAATVLWVRGSGTSSYRNFTIRGGTVATGAAGAAGTAGTSYLWDMDRRTRDMLSTTAIMVDLVHWLDFDNLQPRTKELILGAAAVIFQRRYRGSPDHDMYLKEEQVLNDLVASRIDSRFVLAPINPSPQIAAVLAGGQRGQQ